MQLRILGYIKLNTHSIWKKDCLGMFLQLFQARMNRIRENDLRMKSLVELKLFTNNNTTDINMEILEGKTLELFKPVPINVNANIVYSKYSMNPLKSINFGLLFNPKVFNILYF